MQFRTCTPLATWVPYNNDENTGLLEVHFLFNNSISFRVRSQYAILWVLFTSMTSDQWQDPMLVYDPSPLDFDGDWPMISDRSNGQFLHFTKNFQIHAFINASCMNNALSPFIAALSKHTVLISVWCVNKMPMRNNDHLTSIQRAKML